MRERAIECGINPDTLASYIDSFSYGAYPHGGCGIGLERVIFLYCNMKNIRNSSLFPRDPRRIYPWKKKIYIYIKKKINIYKNYK